MAAIRTPISCSGSAACRAGLVHVPANYALTPTELSYILAQSGARALFHQPALAEAADAAAATVPG